MIQSSAKATKSYNKGVWKYCFFTPQQIVLCFFVQVEGYSYMHRTSVGRFTHHQQLSLNIHCAKIFILLAISQLCTQFNYIVLKVVFTAAVSRKQEVVQMFSNLNSFSTVHFM